MANSWLVKSDPEEYDWTRMLRDKTTSWTGVRNFAARLHLMALKKGDKVLFYHSGDAREIVGITKVEKEYYPDPTATEGEWYCVDLKVEKPLAKPVTLADIKKDPSLKQIPLIRISRLSVMPINADEFNKIMEMAGEK